MKKLIENHPDDDLNFLHVFLECVLLKHGDSLVSPLTLVDNT